jgi:hypothetical protein
MSCTVHDWFEYDHLPVYLQKVSKLFAELHDTMEEYPDGAEKSAGMRKLLEARDCFVRVAIAKKRAEEAIQKKGGKPTHETHSINRRRRIRSSVPDNQIGIPDVPSAS